jgi:uncharacterized protein (TIGR02118 family)
MLKATLLYGHPTDIVAFENYYSQTHLPLAAKMKGVDELVLTKFISAPDGSKAAYYRMAELHFQNAEAMQQTMGSAEGLAATADLANFATGGVTMIIGTIDTI